MLTPLILAAATASASIPSWPDYDCSTLSLPTGASDVCDCIFESGPLDWENPSDVEDPSGTCFELTSNVNPVTTGSGARTKWLERMDMMSFAVACSTDRWFTFDAVVQGSTIPWVDASSGIPWVTTQVLDTMDTGESCGVGVGVTEFREWFWDEDNQSWSVWDSLTGELAVSVAGREGYEPRSIVNMTDEESDVDEMLIRWNDGMVWVANGPFWPEETIDPPEEEEPCDPGKERCQ